MKLNEFAILFFPELSQHFTKRLRHKFTTFGLGRTLRSVFYISQTDMEYDVIYPAAWRRIGSDQSSLIGKSDPVVVTEPVLGDRIIVERVILLFYIKWIFLY